MRIVWRYPPWRPVAMTRKSPTIEFFYFDGCPHWIPAFRILEQVARRLVPQAQIVRTRVESDEQAQALRFQGSPSIRFDSIDLEGRDEERQATSCRLYGADGVPPEWMVEAALLRALGPRNILFVCMANAARSQMAEGLARHMAPPSINVYSAGSVPWGVHPLTVRAMAEIGIDISEQYSKGFDEVPLEQMDALITLCAEQDCPWVPSKGAHLHWPIADPGGVMGTEEQQLDAFRRARDEVAERLRIVFLPAKEG